MKIVNVNFDIKKRLKKSGLLDEMSNLESCDFLVIAEHDNQNLKSSTLNSFKKRLIFKKRATQKVEIGSPLVVKESIELLEPESATKT